MNGCEAGERPPAGRRRALPEAGRAAPERLQLETRIASRSPLVDALLTAADTVMLVLNAQRQIVACNGRGGLRPGEVVGLRPGDALGCPSARGGPGCGAAAACQACGALDVILAAQQRGAPAEAECLVRSEGQAIAREFNARACPVVVEGHRFTALSLRDISGEKRRQALEQIFFHDVLNTITGLRGWTELLHAAPGAHPGAPERILQLSRHLEREVRDHRALVLAEDGTLVPRPERLRASDLLGDLAAVFTSHVVARGRRIEERVAADAELFVDRALLLRVLVNMVRNALEATEPGGAIHIAIDRPAAAAPAGEGRAREAIRFSVLNDGAMPADVQEHVFQRSFSTKAPSGRGLGTYSMKLLGERYLGGAVSFVSNERGTVFTLDLPTGSVDAAAAA